MNIAKLCKELSSRGRGLLLLKHDHGTGWTVTNCGTPKTLIEQSFADLEAVRTWIALQAVNQCDGCRRGLPLDDDGIHRGRGYDMIACTRHRYGATE